MLALLPRMKLHLASDPLGMEHDVSCLLEAVTPGAVPPEQEADSQAPQAPHQPQARPRWPATAGGAAVRLTVFAAAGAVPCWHEGPAEASISLGFNPLTKALSWSVPAFSLRFPGPTCPQVDLFTGEPRSAHRAYRPCRYRPCPPASPHPALHLQPRSSTLFETNLLCHA